ncbi:hypothetical protein EVAR_91175_1 [Eumeta japonica]|uniref:Uncharacterized protein n=1 Tax=Eumeta variegata TaxID=151549 RepID=A0A4C1ZMB5_EUMVA|nr:hypothetical protein EVAR_91175_1 [Eumeta japonica]
MVSMTAHSRGSPPAQQVVTLRTALAMVSMTAHHLTTRRRNHPPAQLIVTLRTALKPWFLMTAHSRGPPAGAVGSNATYGAEAMVSMTAHSFDHPPAQPVVTLLTALKPWFR